MQLFWERIMGSSQHRFLTRLGVQSASVALTLLMATGARADVLVTHALNPDGIAYFSNIAGQQQNADFAFGGNASVTGIRWWGTELEKDSDLGLFTVRVLSDLGGDLALDASLATASQLKTPSGVSQFDLDLSSSPLALPVGNFYLSIMNESTSTQWMWWSGTGGDGISHSRQADSDPWQRYNADDLALQLTGTRNQVPEPGTGTLLLLAGACLLAIRRKEPV
jgi:hypothetical protein